MLEQSKSTFYTMTITCRNILQCTQLCLLLNLYRLTTMRERTYYNNAIFGFQFGIDPENYRIMRLKYLCSLAARTYRFFFVFVCYDRCNTYLYCGIYEIKYQINTNRAALHNETYTFLYMLSEVVHSKE